MMRMLVIGATGYLGGHIRRRAAAAGATVITAGRAPLPGSPAHLRLDLAGDDPARIAGMIASAAPDAVANCAGATTGDPDALSAGNVTSPFALVHAMRLARTPARLVHLGSAAEYGYTTPGAAVDESCPARPASAYGATKLAGTRLVELARADGLDAVVLRVFNPVGAGAPESGLPGSVAAQLRRALATGAAPGAGAAGGEQQGSGSDGAQLRLGPLGAVRDFVDARDVADAVLAAAAAPAVPHAVVNIGSGVGIPVRALVRELIAISGYTTTVREEAPGSARSAALPWQQADIARARADLGWRPRHDLAASLAELWEASHD